MVRHLFLLVRGFHGPDISSMLTDVPVLYDQDPGTIRRNYWNRMEPERSNKKRGFLSQILGIINDECYPPALLPGSYQGPIGIMFAYSKCESLYINAVKYGIHD